MRYKHENILPEYLNQKILVIWVLEYFFYKYDNFYLENNTTGWSFEVLYYYF